MKKINFKILIITCIVCLLPIILGVIYYDQLPEKVAVHFDIKNNVDGYMQKELFVFGMPFLMVALQILCCVPTDLKDENPEANKKALTIYKLIVPALSVILYSVTILMGLGKEVDIGKIICITLGIAFILMGNYSTKIIGTYKNNRNMKDKKLEKKIIKIYSYIMIIFGFAFLMSILIKPIITVILIVLFIIANIVLYFYSLIKDKKE